ncbi:MAG: DUF4062 domain-containing protein [Planctomycetes bacterium]|nr:DUF4062 domain-containing protein [Planctomycetota bacterium]
MGIDLRWGITEEESQKGETLPIFLREIERSRPYFIGLLGERYGWTPARTVEVVSRSLEELTCAIPVAFSALSQRLSSEGKFAVIVIDGIKSFTHRRMRHGFRTTCRHASMSCSHALQANVSLRCARERSTVYKSRRSVHRRENSDLTKCSLRVASGSLEL